MMGRYMFECDQTSFGYVNVLVFNIFLGKVCTKTNHNDLITETLITKNILYFRKSIHLGVYTQFLFFGD